MAIPIRRLLPLLSVLACVVTGSVLGSVALPAVIARLGTEGTPAPDEPKPDQAERGEPLEPLDLMVNLKDAHGRRVLKAQIVFEAKDRKTKVELEKRTVEIKHLLISLMSDRRLEDIEKKEQKEMLLRTIRLSVNEHVAVPDAVLHVYFTQFLVQ